jgi:hypothetical protein
VLLPENRLVSVSQLWLPSVVSIQVTAVPALWPGHVCSPGDSGQAEDVGACPVGQVGAGNGGVHGLWVIASRGAPGSTGARPCMSAVCNAASTCARSPAPAGESGLSSRSGPVATNIGAACLRRQSATAAWSIAGAVAMRSNNRASIGREPLRRGVEGWGSVLGPVGARIHCTTIRSPPCNGCRLPISHRAAMQP